LKEAVVANVEPSPFPEAATASVKAPLIRTEIWAWNAQMNYIYANGGPETTHNSLMEKHNANVKLSARMTPANAERLDCLRERAPRRRKPMLLWRQLCP